MFGSDLFLKKTNGKEGSGGGSGHMHHTFIVSPPLSENLSGIELLLFTFWEDQESHHFVI
ncbi:hypothetical protein AN964_13560 [Heyndrickxia shackletonii]|uniref:Uncharacterized protein n=1 Tax=Heyndrickxia shackletonii TaxID=157838 RepID=A0A0Q3WT69_9BACI|nr:hypothetical protein [Heyndrickxia shackletonii]KQL54421.1 hypothetical protein AN964_13560 [Heyndrickxia shackletonii]